MTLPDDTSQTCQPDALSPLPRGTVVEDSNHPLPAPHRRTTIPAFTRLIVLAGLLLLLGVAAAQSSGGIYSVRKQVVSSGGQRVSSGTTTVTASIAQAAVDVQAGGVYRVAGGFLSAPAPASAGDPVFRNGFE